jgi:hypothetical protein
LKTSRGAAAGPPPVPVENGKKVVTSQLKMSFQNFDYPFRVFQSTDSKGF